MRLRSTIYPILLLAILPLLMAGESADHPRDLADMLAPLAEKYSLPGVVGAIVHGDAVVALGSVGVRKIGSPQKFLPTDVIHLGSDTKAMTAILIGQLIDKGQLRFDTTMQEIFPHLPMDREKARVTIRQLLDHNAGLPHDLDWWGLDATHDDIKVQRHLAVRQALSTAPETPIGKFSYSNVGYVVLGAIIEEKTGRPWEEVIRQNIFKPLHMTSGGFGPPGIIGQVNEPWGHVRQGQIVPVQIDNPPVMSPAGRVHCSIGDWAKFISEALRGARGHPTLVTVHTFTELTTPLSNQDYAGGWIIAPRPWAGGTALTHAGSNTTWYCNVWIAPGKDFAVLLATNYGSDPVAQAADEGVGLLIQFNETLSAGR
jgi:CubicO group peptidase (beta-lactamase class C family)